MYEMMKKQNFGVEIELTGITRAQAAKVVADYYGGATEYAGGTYGMCTASDRKGRTWKTMSDASIHTERWVNGELESCGFGGREYSCEVVTPILQYEDLPDLENIVNALKAAGAVANDSCGIHVHVDGANHTPESLTRLLNFAVGRQDLSTTDADTVKAYIQFCLAMSAWALAGDTLKLHFTSCANYTREKKARLMHSVLTNRLGLRGAEFKACREILTAAFQKADSQAA